MAFYLDLEVGESVTIGEALVTVEHKNGRKARLSIDADRKIPVTLVKQKDNQDVTEKNCKSVISK